LGLRRGGWGLVVGPPDAEKITFITHFLKHAARR
jgi:KaiC/GvpD/RAD55 family RecA-like ATPase